MPIVVLDNIHISFGTGTVFESLGMRLYPKEKVGLVGPNGCGKTTLLKLILDKESADKGDIRRRKNMTIGYLPQEPQFDDDKTVLQELHAGAKHILRLQNKIHDQAERLEKLKGTDLNAAMKQYDRLTHEFEIAGGYGYENKIKEIAAGLGLDKKFYSVMTNELSGGQKSRLGLAKVLLKNADLLLLDEPTNHLDWDATLWLEDYLNSYPGAALIVSHDRFLLDRLVTKIIEIRNRKATTYKGNYSTYKIEKQKHDLEHQRQYQQRVEFVARTRDFIARNKDQEGMSKVARGRKKQLEDLLRANPDYLDKPITSRELGFEFSKVDQKSQRSDVVLACENMDKAYDELILFNKLNVEVRTGERLGIIGPNGTGKTTLLKLALGEIKPSSGTITTNRFLSIGYLDQAGSLLNDNNTVIEEISPIVPDLNEEQKRGRLGAFLFSGDDAFKKVANLSGGERNRLALLKLVLSSPEVLILDEPTNHLDIPSIEALEQALTDYAGTVIVVSHDRFFLDKIVDKLLVLGVDTLGHAHSGTYELVNGSVKRYMELLQQRQKAKSAEQEKLRKAKPAKKRKPKTSTPKELRQFTMWTIEKLEAAIEKTEIQIKELHEKFGSEDVYKNPDKLTQLQENIEEKQNYHDLLYKAYERKL